MRRAIFVILTAVVLGLAGCGDDSGGSTDGPFAAKAEQVVDNVAANNLGPVLVQFSPDMAANQTAEDVATNWKMLERDLGPYKLRGEAEGVQNGDVTIQRVPVTMTNGKGEVQVSYAANGSIVGLYFQKANDKD